MNTKHITLLMAGMLLLVQCRNAETEAASEISKQTLMEEFVEWRFGMFICYNIMSYGAKWGEAHYPISVFNPEKLDAGQWADAAVSAHMKFGLLTTKHHEGLCLWDSEYTDYDVASSPYGKDIVRQYVDAFRSRGLGIGLYYSIWDSTHDIDKGMIDSEKLDFVKGQITELLSNYGKIDYFVMDGWFWRMGHRDEVPYHEIRELIKRLQPHCLITDHTHIQAPFHMDIPYFEGPFGAFPAKGNTMASALGHCSLKGNGWFWSEKTPDGMKENDGVDTVLARLERCEERYCNFMLNCMPNRDGLLDPIYTDLLSEIGLRWQADLSRPVLPDQGPLIANSIPIASVQTSSGQAEFLYEKAALYQNDYFDWESDEHFPQEIIIDMGEERSDVDVLTMVHKHRCRPYPEAALTEGNIMGCKIYASTDGRHFELLTSKSWPRTAAFRSVRFEARKLRYLKIDIMDVNGPSAIISNLEVGTSSK